jgi:hypothetical protein
MYNPTFIDVPLTCLNGSAVDISVLLRFYYWQTVYYKISESSFLLNPRKVYVTLLVLEFQNIVVMPLPTKSLPKTPRPLYTAVYCVQLAQMMPTCEPACLEGKLEPIMKLSNEDLSSFLGNSKAQKGHPEYRNSQYNFMIEWENGEITKEPLR